MAQVTVWFDGACPLCIREIALMRRLDRRGAISFVDVAKDDGASDDASCPINRADLLAKFHAREDGQLLSGAAAFAAMWRAIPVLRPFGLLARRPWALKALDALYRRFLRVRPKLQRWVTRMESGR
jgi:predicted DCC family thiol-disulfide oxidoreductase YuxK